MNTYKTKHALLEMIEQGLIQVTDKTELKCYPKPQGAFCNVSVCEETGANIFFNNESEYVDSDFGKYLVEFGITGEFIIKTSGNVRGTTKWLNYNLNNVPFEDWFDKLMISQLGINPNLKPSALHIENINPVMIPYNQLYFRNNQLAKFDDFDGLIVEAEDVHGQTHHFYLVPTRYVSGNVASVIKDKDGEITKLVLSIYYQNKRYILLINTFTAKTKKYMETHGVNIDQQVTIQYTSFFGGNRLVNFASPILVTIKN